ncbi:MAG TPA: cytochrome c [Vicinamibacterales bacterium]|nr:cytochrome c [Vicinamibacterales bacterium]
MCVVAAVLGASVVLGAREQAGDVAKGEAVFVAQKCSLCHAVAGKGNKNGALDGVGTKLSATELREWIVNPAEMTKKHNTTRKPPMKAFASLPKEDVDALVAYLQTLKK